TLSAGSLRLVWVACWPSPEGRLSLPANGSSPIRTAFVHFVLPLRHSLRFALCLSTATTFGALAGGRVAGVRYRGGRCWGGSTGGLGRAFPARKSLQVGLVVTLVGDT